jgi:hypothetical protein
MTLWLCDACSCGYLERGDDAEDRVERYLDCLHLKGFERAQLRERILEAKERLSLDDRGMIVVAALRDSRPNVYLTCGRSVVFTP